jgi:hypothetical protein
MLVLTVPGLLPPLQLMRKIASATIASSNPITCAQTHYSVLLNFGLDDSNVPCSNLIAQVTFVHQEGHSVRTVHQTYAEYPLIIFSKDGKERKRNRAGHRRREWKLPRCPAARRLYSRCARPRTQTYPRQAATVHGCLESDRPRRYGC